MLIELHKPTKNKKPKIIVDGKPAINATINVMPNGVSVKYKLEDEPKREYDRLFTTITEKVRKPNMQIIELKDEQPSGDWIWERQRKRGVIV